MPNPIPDDQITALQELIFSRRKIAAIKLYRELTGEGLKEAKEAVEDLERSLQTLSPEKFSAPAKGRGCLGAAVACVGVAGAIFWIFQG